MSARKMDSGEVGMRDFREQNRQAWNEAMLLHDRRRGDQVGFFLSGGSTLYPLELEDLGDLRGRRVLHLQCNDGRDSLSLAGLGAEVTGVDISDEAISRARTLSQQTGIPAEFLRMDVLDFRLEGRLPYDLVYGSRGVLCWIEDLRQWMEVAAGALRPSGFLYLIDDHPVLTILDEILDEDLRARWSYFHAAEPEVSVGLDYLGQRGEAVQQNFQWQWPLGDIIALVVDAGLRIRYLREHLHTFYRRWPQLIERDRLFYLPEGAPSAPLSFTLRADKA